MASNEEVVNEYLLDAYGMKKQQVEELRTALNLCQQELREVIERYETTLNTYADVCRRADRMQNVGNVMRDLLMELVVLSDKRVDQAIQEWGEANV